MEKDFIKLRYWKRVDAEGKTRTVESYSHDLGIEGAVEISKEEYEAFIAGLPKPEPPVDWRAEWSKAVTPADKLRLLGRFLGWE